MDTYHKIQSIYKRDARGNILNGQWATEAIGFLAGQQWTWTEKVDGTNIRLRNDEGRLVIGGRTDRAQIPTPLVDWLHAHVDPATLADGATYYGEGYGGKIQRASATYGGVQRFVLFDVRVGRYWLHRPDMDLLALDSGMDVVPEVGRGTLHEAIAFVNAGQQSRWGDFTAEGIVCRPSVQVFDRFGQRVIVKIKARDFKQEG